MDPDIWLGKLLELMQVFWDWDKIVGLPLVGYI